MSGEEFYRGQVVDTPTAAEFARLTLEKVSLDDLILVAGLAERKSAALRPLLAPDHLVGLSEDEARMVLQSIFSSRRRAGVILDALTLDGFVAKVDDLLWGARPANERLAAFYDTIAGIGRGVRPQVGFDLGSELLHFTDPDQHWLWTQWMWDPELRTGALPLVVTEEVDLDGGNVAETYRRVGLAVAFVNEVGDAAGFRTPGHGVFGTDVFLACVYAVYMYTTLRMRMTQEFNQVVPQLGELIRRLLGVYRSPLLAEVIV